MSLQVCSITYAHPGEDVLFHDMSLSVSDGEKIAVAGNNGAGKSTLLKIISGELLPSCGQVMYEGKVYVVPQHFGQFNDMTVAHALGVGKSWRLCIIFWQEVYRKTILLLLAMTGILRTVLPVHWISGALDIFRLILR